MGVLAFLRVGVWMNGLRAFRNGFMGNVSGEGFVLGGVFVIGRGEQVRLRFDLIQLLKVKCMVTLQVSLFLFSCREYFWSTERWNLGIKSTLRMSCTLSEEYHRSFSLWKTNIALYNSRWIVISFV